MRYKEFAKKIEDWGRKYGYVTEVTIDDWHTYVNIELDEFYVIACISNIYIFGLETRWNYFSKIKNHARGELFNILVELAKTPPEEREEEKKYYLRLSIFGYDDEQNYLNLERDTGEYLFGSKKDIAYYQTQFTQKEIDEMKKNYNLDSFEIEDVEE